MQMTAALVRRTYVENPSCGTGGWSRGEVPREEIGSREDSGACTEDTVECRPQVFEDSGPARCAQGSTSLSLSNLATATAEAPVDALHQDELGRMHVFAQLVAMLALAAAVLTPILGGERIAQSVFIGSMVLVVLGNAWLSWITRTAERFRPGVVGAWFQVLALGGHGAAYYFGVFSPFPAITAIAIYVLALGSSVRSAALAYANLAAGQALLAGLIISGAIADHGLVHAKYLTGSQQIALQVCLQMVYLVAFLLGRMGRERTVKAVHDLEVAVREIAQREALLHEARMALARAEQGGPGRYTDQVVGSYRLGVIIGRGSMGEIYEAQHVTTGASAAVKLLHARAPGDSPHTRFLREAKMAASLSAPNLVRVLEIGDEDAPVPYLAMERLIGQDLGHILRERSRLPLAEVLEMVQQVSRGLDVARQAGIVHRDLKPQNIFRIYEAGCRRPVWKVLDFGVSKLSGDESSLTGGRLVGTPAYMAPEQATGAAVDHRADLYSLAVIAYRCLTGRPAFAGAQIPQVLYQVVNQMPQQPSKLGALPADVDAVLAIGMAKRPKNRFASTCELAKALSEAARGQLDDDVRARAAALLRRHPWCEHRA